MAEKVFLVDDNDATIVVACPDRESAVALAAAATMNDADVSAYLLPPVAVPASEWGRVRSMLRGGADVMELRERYATDR